MNVLIRWENPFAMYTNIYISNHHDIHFNYLTIVFVNYTSMKLKLKQEIILYIDSNQF